LELELLKQVSQFGLLGIILALVWWIALRLWGDLKVSWEARIVENKHLVSVIEATNSTYMVLASATENRAKANEAMSQAQQATSKALEAQTKAFERVAQGNETLTRYMDKLMLQSDTLREEIKSAHRLVSEMHRVRVRGSN
jgi:cellobiose-specific phosphotransferase system component IIA